MPNISTVGLGTGLDNVEYVLNLARALSGDILQNTAGEILTDDWPSTYSFLNIAYRKCQHYLNNNGVEFNIREIIIDGLTPVINSDPAIQVILSSSGYFNGSTWTATPALPPNLLQVLRVWERFSGTQNPWCQITPARDGIPGDVLQVQQFRLFDWRAQNLYFPGATQTNEIRLRFQQLLPELSNPGDILPWCRLSLALAYKTAAEFVSMSDGEKAATLEAKAMDELDDIVNQTVRFKQRKGTQKRGYGGGGGRPGFTW